MQALKINDTTGSSLQDYTQLIMDLLTLGQTLCKQTHSIGKHLCQEVMRATEGKARLLLPCQDSSTGPLVPFPISVSFPVRSRNRIHRTLEIAPRFNASCVPCASSVGGSALSSQVRFALVYARTVGLHRRTVPTTGLSGP